jgi:hypothetical protein
MRKARNMQDDKQAQDLIKEYEHERAENATLINGLLSLLPKDRNLHALQIPSWN